MSGQTSIRFVMEGPQNTKTRQKKRARLVTACDECRIRKVRCHQTKPNEACEACKASQVKCHFGDRDRYHAERGLASTNNTNGTTKSSSSRRGSLIDGRPSPTSPRDGTSTNGHHHGLTSATSSNTSSPMSSFAPLSSSSGGGGEQSWMENSRSRSQSTSEYPSNNSPRLAFNSSSNSSPATTSPRPSPTSVAKPMDLCFVAQSATSTSTATATASSATTATTSFDNSSLFDSSRPDHPRPDLLEHLIEVFFDRLGCQLPFLQKDIILTRFRSFSLPDHVANGIAALAARFSDKPELFIPNSPKWAAGEPFLHKAKLSVVHQISWPTLDALHTLILIAWAEYGSARDSGLFNFARMASSMLVDLGISTRQALERVEDEQERKLLRLTWAGVVRIDLTSAWVTGRSASLQDTQLQTDPFTRPEDPPPTTSPTCLLLDRLTKLYTIRDEVTKMMNSDCSRPMDDRPIQNMLISIQNSLSTFYSTLGPQLQFTSENFKRFKSNKQASLFLLLHLTYHGSNTLVNWPSLFKEFARPMPHNVSVSCASARSLVSALRIAYTIDRSTLLANPFFDVPISVAARAFLAQRTVMVPDQTTIDNSWIESNLGTCMDVLANMAQYWGGSDIVGELLEQRGAKFHRRTPSARNSVNSPIISRPSLLLRRGSQAGQDSTTGLRLPLSSIQASPASGSYMCEELPPPTSAPPTHLSLARSLEYDSPLTTPRQERVSIQPLLAGPSGTSLGMTTTTTTSSSSPDITITNNSNNNTTTAPDTEDVFASFFQQNLTSGSGTIDNLNGSHITTSFASMSGSGGNQMLSTTGDRHHSSLSDNSGFSSLLASTGLDHALYPNPTPQW